MADLNFSVGFNVEQNGQLDNYLKKLELGLNNIGKTNGAAKITDELFKSTEQAQELKSILSRLYDSKSGFSLSGLNTEMAAIGNSAEKLKGQFTQFGQAGSIAYNSMASSAFQANLQIKQSSQLLNKAFDTFKNAIRYTLSGMVVRGFVSGISDAYNYVKKLDTALNDIRIVTGLASEEMDKFAVAAQKSAKAMGSDTLSYVKGALLYYQQGIRDADELRKRTEVTTKVSNVTNLSTADATQALTAVWNGYQIAAEDAEKTIDKLAAVAANSAVDLEYLTTAMSKTAAAANTMGLPIDNLNAMIATTGAVTQQSAETIGTAYKTIIARLSDLKVEGFTEEDGITTTYGDISKQMLAAGIDIKDQNGNLRDTVDLITEIGSKWQDWNKGQKDAVAIAMAGKRQYTQLFALFDNWGMYNDLVQTSADSQGELQKQQDTYMQSTAAHLKQLSTEAERTYSQFFDTEGLNKLIDTLNAVLTKFNDFIGGFNSAGDVIVHFGTIFTSVFSKQIAKSLQQTIQNYKIVKENQQQLNNLTNLANTGMATSGMAFGTTGIGKGSGVNTTTGADIGAVVNGKDIDADVMQRYFNVQKQIYSVAKDMSTEEYNQLQTDQARLTVVEQELKERQALIAAAGDKSSAELTRDAKSAEETVAQEEQIIEKTTEAQTKVQNLNAEFAKTGDVQAYKKGLEDLKNTAQELPDVLKAVDTALASINSANGGQKGKKTAKAGATLDAELEASIKGHSENADAKTKDAEASRAQAEAVREGTGALEGERAGLESSTQGLIKNTAQRKSLTSSIQKISAAIQVLNSVNSLLKTTLDDTASSADKANAAVSTIGSVIGTRAGLALTSVMGPAGMMVGQAIGGLSSTLMDAVGITDLINEKLKTSAEIIDEISEKVSKSAEAEKNYAEANGVLNDMEERWNVLIEKAGTYGEGLSTMTQAEQEEYHNLLNTIASYNEDIVIGYDEQGNAIANNNTALNETRQLLKQIRLEQAGFTSSEDFLSDSKKARDKATKERESKRSSSNQLVKDQTQVLFGVGAVESYYDRNTDYEGALTKDVEAVNKDIDAINAMWKLTNMEINTMDDLNAAQAIIDGALADATDKTLIEEIQMIQDSLDGVALNIVDEIDQGIKGTDYVKSLKADQDFGFYDKVAELSDSTKAAVSAAIATMAEGSTIEELEQFGEQGASAIIAGYQAGITKDSNAEDVSKAIVDLVNSPGISNLDEDVKQSLIELIFGVKITSHENGIWSWARDVVDSAASNIRSAAELMGSSSQGKSLLSGLLQGDADTEALTQFEADIAGLGDEYAALGDIQDKTSSQYIDKLREILELLDEQAVVAAKNETVEAYDLVVSSESTDEFFDNVESWLNAEHSFDVIVRTQMDDTFNMINDQVAQVASAANMIGENYKVAAEDVYALGQAFPGILDGYQIMEDGMVQLNQETVDAIVGSKEAEVQSAAEAAAAQMEIQGQLLTEKAGIYQQIADTANTYAQQEADGEEVSAKQRQEISGMLTKAMEIDSELQANAAIDSSNAEQDAQTGVVTAYENASQAQVTAKQTAYQSIADMAVDAANAEKTGQPVSISGATVKKSGNVTSKTGSYTSSQKGKSSKDTVDIQSAADNNDWGAVAEAAQAQADAAMESANKAFSAAAALRAKGSELANQFKNLGTGKDSGSGGGSEKEAEKFDKIAQSLENAASAADHYKKVYDNAHDSASRLDALDNMTAALEDQKAAIEQAIAAYKVLLEEYGKDPNLPADIKALIDGDMDFSAAYEELNEDQKKAVDKYSEMSDTIDDLEEEELDVEESMREAWMNRIDEIQNKYKSMIGEMENEADALQDSIKYQETVGEFVLGDNYFALIDNAKKQLGTYEDELSDLYDMLDSAPDADARLDIEDEIRSIESSMRDLTQSIAEYVETLKSIPNNIYSNMLSMVSNNASDINNAIAEATAHGLQTTQAQYEALIKNSAESTKYLERQRSFLQKMLGTYQVGSDKYYEVLTQLQAVDDQISKNTQDTYKWQQAILEISYSYIEEAQSEIDKQINVIQDDIDDIQDQIDGIDDEIEKISRKIELIQRVIDNEEEKQDEWQEIIQAVADAYQDAIDKLTDERTAYEESMNSKIDLLNEQLDLLNENNEALDKQLAIEQALYDLDKAREQQTVRVIRNGKVSYEADQNAVRQAENAYAEALYNKKVYDLQQEIKVLENERDKQLEAYDDQIEALNEQAEVWSTIVENIEKAVRAAKASEYFGSEDWAIKITGDAEYSKQQADIMSAQYGKSVELVNRLNDEVKVLEDQKLILEDQKYDLNQQIEKLNKQIELLEDQKEILDDTKSTIEDFVKQWQKGQLNFDQAMAEIKKVIGADLQKEINGNDSQVNKITSYSNKQVQVTQQILDQLTQAEQNAYAATQVKATSTRSSSRSSGSSGGGKSSNVSMGWATEGTVSVGRSDIGPGGSSSSLATAQSIAKQYASGDVAGAKAAAAAGGYKIETKAEGGVIGGGTLPNRLMDLIRKAYGADAMPLIGHKGELVLNRDQQANLIKNIQSAQLAAMFANPRFRNAGADSAQVISITMGNLTLPNVQNGNDFADFIANNLETAVGQRVNRK